MWIRSQDRKILTEIHNLDIDDIGQIWDGSSLLGKYSTEEKALKVLDEIQGKIECPYPSKTMPVFDTNCYHLIEKSKLYQMPQDEDVEI